MKVLIGLDISRRRLRIHRNPDIAVLLPVLPAEVPHQGGVVRQRIIPTGHDRLRIGLIERRLASHHAPPRSPRPRRRRSPAWTVAGVGAAGGP